MRTASVDVVEDGLGEPIDDAKGTSQHIFDEANPISGPARWCLGGGGQVLEGGGVSGRITICL